MPLYWPEPDLVEGTRLLYLIQNPSTWVHRRIERTRFMRESRVRREISIEFSLPPELPPEVAPAWPPADPTSDMLPLPLTFLNRNRRWGGSSLQGPLVFDSPLTALEVRDARNHILPVLTSDEGAHLCWSILLAAAAEDRRIAPEDAKDLSGLRDALPVEVYDGLANLLDRSAKVSPTGSRWRRPQWATRTRLSDDFWNLAESLAERRLVLVEATRAQWAERQVWRFNYEVDWKTVTDTEPGEPSDEELLQFEYNTGFHRWLSRQRFSRMLGLYPTRCRFTSPSSWPRAVRHIEIEAPEGLEAVCMAVETPPPCARSSVEPLPTPSRVVHLVAVSAPQRPDARSVIPLVWLRLPKRGYISWFTLLSTFSGVVLVTGAVTMPFVPDLDTARSAAASLLLVVPTIVTALVLQPTEHLIVAQVLVGVRRLVVASALLLNAAAFTLIPWASADLVLELSWATLALIATAIAVILWGAYNASARRWSAPAPNLAFLPYEQYRGSLPDEIHEGRDVETDA